MENNLQIYEQVRGVPTNAKKTITAGRLKGMTDINPMWRIKTLTEQFGACGTGWYYNIKEKWLDNTLVNDEITANVEIELFVKVGGEWSKPIVGVGGSKLVAKERSGPYVNDECYKMALTDAISVACKSLGMGADVYWQSDNTKYNDAKRGNEPKQASKAEITERDELKAKVLALGKEKGISAKELAKDYKLNAQTTAEEFKKVLEDLEGESNAECN